MTPIVLKPNNVPTGTGDYLLRPHSEAFIRVVSVTSDGLMRWIMSGGYHRTTVSLMQEYPDALWSDRIEVVVVEE